MITSPPIVLPASGRVDATLGAVVGKTKAGWVAGDAPATDARADRTAAEKKVTRIAKVIFRMGTIVSKAERDMERNAVQSGRRIAEIMPVFHPALQALDKFVPQ